jgi:hypothetical protein
MSNTDEFFDDAPEIFPHTATAAQSSNTATAINAPEELKEEFKRIFPSQLVEGIPQLFINSQLIAPFIISEKVLKISFLTYLARDSSTLGTSLALRRPTGLSLPRHEPQALVGAKRPR